MGPSIVAVAVSDREETFIKLAPALVDLLPEARLRTLAGEVPGPAAAELEAADVVLLDGSMSGSDPLELCRRLKDDPRLQHLPVLMLLPEDSSPEFSLRAFQAGADGLLSLPFSPAELAAQLRTLAKLGSAGRARPLTPAGGEPGTGKPHLPDGLPADPLQERALWRTAFDALADVVLILDREGRVLRSNRAAEAVFQRPLAEIVGRRCSEIIGCGHAGSNCPPICRIGETRQREILSLDVGERWTEVVLEPAWDQTGSLIGAVMILRDLTRDIAAHQRIAQQQANEKLAESEARYRALFENMNAGFVLFEVVTDDAGNPVDLTILAGNEGFERTTGLRLAEVVGQRLCVVLPGIEKDPADWIGTYGKVALTGQPCRFERDSQLLGRWYSVNAYCPAPKQCAVTFLDVTEARRTSRERDLLYEAIALSVNEVYLFDADTWRFRFVSQGGQRNLGYTMDQLREMTPLDLKAEFDADRFEQLLLPLLRGEKSCQTFETVHRRADGSLYPVEVRLQLFEHNGDRVFLAIILDLTQRRRAEAERSRLLQVIDRARDSIVVTDPDGTIQYVNPAFEAVTGYRRAEVLGRNPNILKSGHHDQAFYRELWETITGGRTWAGRIVNRRRDGTLYTEETTISPVMDEGGNIINFLAVKRDITQQLQAAEERVRLEEQLHRAQRLESVGRLAGGIAHDFNNMLGVILGYGESILEQLREGDPLREDIREIVEAARRSSALTRQLLAFSRRQTLQPQVINLNTVIRNMERLLGRLLGEDIHLQLLLSEDLHPVLADPAQMEQVIMNLAVNARDAMPDGGTLILETSNRPLDEEYARTHVDTEPGEYVMLAVTDTGVGMEKEVLERIFDPFFTTKEEGLGTGLGLSVVYGMVKQSGGHIWVYSEPGQGTTFKIYLPKTDRDACPAEKKLERAAPVTGKGQVLVVEDEEGLRRLLQSFLTRLGYTVTVAANGGEALLLVEEKGLRPDLIVTDVVMPKMSGRELVRRLQRDHPEIRALYMSGYTESAIGRNGLLEPGIHFIQKPFSIRDLAEAVRRALGDRAG